MSLWSCRAAAFLLASGVFGCSAGSDVSIPTSIDLRNAQISAAGPTTIFGQIGSEARDLPAVVITEGTGTKPVPGVTVFFSVTGTRSETDTAVTGSDGIARMKSLKIDGVPRQYSVLARADGTAYVEFTTLALSQAPVAVYDLRSIHGDPVPVTYEDSASIQVTYWKLTGAQYVLLDDGSYIYGDETTIGGTIFGRRQKFVRLDAETVDFYSVAATEPLPPGFPDPSYLLSTGTMMGDTLIVEYPPPHSSDTPDEVYILRH